MYKLQEYIKDSLNENILDEIIINEVKLAKIDSAIVTYDVEENAIMGEFTEASVPIAIKILINEISLIIQEKEIIKGEDLFSGIDLKNIDVKNVEIPILVKAIENKKNTIIERCKKLKIENIEDLTDCAIKLGNVQLWPPGGSKLDTFDIECYIDFAITMNIYHVLANFIKEFKEIVKNPDEIKTKFDKDNYVNNLKKQKISDYSPILIDIGSLHIVGLGKISLKPFLNLYFKYNFLYFRLLYYILNNFIDMKPNKKSFITACKKSQKDIKKLIKNDINDLKKLPDTVEKDENADVKTIVQKTINIFKKLRK